MSAPAHRAGVAVPETTISDHAFLADGHSAVLVDRTGSVNWWCPQRFDTPSVFGRLLDADAGHWSIRPVRDARSEWSYLTDTLVLRTRHTTTQGAVAVVDALALEPGARGHDVGLRSPRLLARVVYGLSGTVPVRMHYRPRFEYGRVIAYLQEQDGVLIASAGATRLALRASVPLTCGEGEAYADFTVREGQVETFTLGYAPAYDTEPPEAYGARDVVDNAVSAWRSWLNLHDYQGLYRDQVRRSALVVQGMTYRPAYPEADRTRHGRRAREGRRPTGQERRTWHTTPVSRSRRPSGAPNCNGTRPPCRAG